MWRKGIGFVQLMDEEAGGEKGGGGGGQGDGGGGQPFADAAAARTFLGDYVNDAELLKAVPDDKVIPWAGHVKGKVDGLGTQFPANWRKQIAGEDEKELKQLERYATPQDVWKKARALEQRISSGELKASVPFPEKGTAEEQIAWRKGQGIPEKPEGYELKLASGLVIGDADKPFVDAFLKDAHASHMSPAHVNAAVNSYFKLQEAQIAQAQERWNEQVQSTEDTLRKEWGADYRKHVAHVQGFLGESLADETLRTQVLNTVKSNPDIAKWVLGMALEMNPAGTIVPGDGQNQAQSITDEIGKLKTMMGDRNSEYWKGPNAEKNQARYRHLLDAQTKLQKRAA